MDVISDEALVYREKIKGPGRPAGRRDRPGPAPAVRRDRLARRRVADDEAGVQAGLPPLLRRSHGPRPIVESKMGSSSETALEDGGEESRLILIPFSPYQVATTDLPQEFEPTVFRRFMRMVAESLAAALEFLAISTGDNLAQVASQTLQNIACIDSGAVRPDSPPAARLRQGRDSPAGQAG